jgi:hypothetical protein
MSSRVPRIAGLPGPYAQPVPETFFAVSYAPVFLPLFRLLGMGSRQSGVWVSPASVRVVMGWGFRTTIPRSAVQQIAPDSEPVTGWGVHGWRGLWLVNGSSAGLVRIEIEPAVQAWVVGVPVRLKTLRLSVTSPGELINELGGGQ